MRKKLSLIAALIAFFAMTAVTFAANTAKITVTSEPITWKAPCDKAGAISFSFDDNTTFVSGDIITGDLPMNVVLCKEIDFIAGLARGNADPLPYNETYDWTFGNAAAPNNAYFLLPPIGTDANGPLTGDGFLTSTLNGVVFWVRGSVGSQRVTITVLSDRTLDLVDEVEPDLANLPSMTFHANNSADVNSKLVLNILDQKVYPSSTSALFTDRNKNVGPNATYFNRVAASENTLCINVSHPDFNNEYVKMSFDSKADKYTWIPSDPQIAHVVPQKLIQFAACVKPECGYIQTPRPGSQGTAQQCVAIDNEAGNGIRVGLDYATTDDGYCPTTHRNNRMILQNVSGLPFDTGNYQIQLEILVNNTLGDHGAYFAGAINAIATTTLTQACSPQTNSISRPTIYYNGADDYSGSTYQLDATGTLNSGLGPITVEPLPCSIPLSNRITKVKTDAISTLFNGTDQSFLWVDIPDIVWDPTVLTEGKVLSVRVTLLKAPCGQLFTGDLCIGTRGCQVGNDPDACYEFTRIYPFFGKEADYMNVMGITNTTSNPLTFAVTVYEKDGDKFSGSIVVPANTVQATIVASLPGATLLAGSTGSGILGDSQSYATVKVVAKGSDEAPFIGFIYLFDKIKLGQSFSTTQDDPIKGVPVTCP